MSDTMAVSTMSLSAAPIMLISKQGQSFPNKKTHFMHVQGSHTVIIFFCSQMSPLFSHTVLIYNDNVRHFPYQVKYLICPKPNVRVSYWMFTLCLLFSDKNVLAYFFSKQHPNTFAPKQVQNLDLEACYYMKFYWQYYARQTILKLT